MRRGVTPCPKERAIHHPLWKIPVGILARGVIDLPPKDRGGDDWPILRGGDVGRIWTGRGEKKRVASGRYREDLIE
jgi:hypothetical protein